MERIAEVEKGSLQTKCERKWEALGATIKQVRIEARHNSRIARVLETNKEGILLCAAYPRIHHSHVSLSENILLAFLLLQLMLPDARCKPCPENIVFYTNVS